MKIENFNFAGHKAIVRVDFNVPLDENGNVTDDTRIRGALPTLKKVLADGGALIMMSHMGKPKGKVKPELSLSQIVKNVSDALGVDVKFAKLLLALPRMVYQCKCRTLLSTSLVHHDGICRRARRPSK